MKDLAVISEACVLHRSRKFLAGVGDRGPKMPYSGGCLPTACLVAFMAVVLGCGSAKSNGTVERGAIPPEWTAASQQPTSDGAGGSARSTMPSAPGALSGEDGSVIAAVDRYRDIISRFGGQAEVNLDFSRTAISDDDLARLPLPDTVRSIDLSVTQIGDVGLEHLMRARRLERLNLSGTKVTEAGCKTLKKMPHLWSVNLDQSQVPLETQLQLLRFFASRAEARTQARPR